MQKNNNAASLALDYIQENSKAKIISTTTSRLYSLDILRGVSVIGMGFVHSREFVGSQNYSNLDWNLPAIWEGSNVIDFIQQAFMTSIGASGFFMLMGVGVILFYHARLAQGWTIEKITYHLALRGCVLIIIQMTLLQLFEMYIRQQYIIYVGVLAALGGCMLIAAAMIFIMHRFSRWRQSSTIFYFLPILLSIITALAISHLVTQVQNGLIATSAIKVLLFLSGHYPLSMGIDLDVNFTALPWLPIVAIGMLLGQCIYDFPRQIPTFTLRLAIYFLVTWGLLRTGNIFQLFQFGEYKLTPADTSLDITAYFTMSKYPPSICLILWSVGINLLVVSLLYRGEERMTQKFALIKPLIVFGQCSLLFFILHWFVYYGLSFLMPTPLQSILSLLSFALFGLMILYPICKNYWMYKKTLPLESILRLF